MTLASEPYMGAFQILSNDFKRLLEFVEPADANLRVYSHRTFELLLRACTEFESACKELLVSASYPKPSKDMTVNDYKSLEASWGLESREVGILMWQPHTRYVAPFKGWSSSTPPLPWYSDYNRVKHNRNADFVRASLENVSLALGGHFLLLEAVGVIRRGMGYQERSAKGGAAREGVFPGHIFSVVR